MTPLPKQRQSRGRTHRRRSHDALRARKLVECPSCHTPRLPHHACPNCGTYRGRTAIEVASED